MTTPDSDPSQAVLIVGSVAFDDLELPTIHARDVVGGSATYSAIAASLFCPARIVAVIGDDFPEAVLEELRQRGVDTAGIERARGKTFRWAGRYSHNLASRLTLDTQLNVFAEFRPKLPPSYRQTSHLLLGNIHPALQLDVLDQVQAPRLVVADTMNFWIEKERALLGKVLPRLDILVINDEELRQLADEHNVRRAASRVLAMGPKRLVVKRGEYGAMLFDEHGIFFAPAYPLEDEIDPTGAGDSFAGALLGQLVKDGEADHFALCRALMIAATVASFCVEGVGTERLMKLSRNDVAQRLESLRTLVRFGA
jgi:sugar/nucleoside kinase (ribokinase family)